MAVFMGDVSSGISDLVVDDNWGAKPGGEVREGDEVVVGWT